MDNSALNQQAPVDQIPPSIKTFLEGILDDANMSNVDPQMREEMIKELFLRLDNFMLTTIVESLPPEKLDEFTKMSDNGGSRDQLENYLKENVPNATEVFARAMIAFRDTYLGNVNASRNTPPEDQSTDGGQKG